MKQYQEFNFLQRVCDSLIRFVEKKLYKRDWTYSDQVYNAMIKVQQDQQWMSHNNIVTRISERHYKMLSKDWYTTAFDSVDAFRDKLGLNPHNKKS